MKNNEPYVYEKSDFFKIRKNRKNMEKKKKPL